MSAEPTRPAVLFATRDLELLSEAECSTLREEIFEIREHWTRWFPAVPFYTVGAASYKDAATHGYAAYSEKARRLNPILAERFGWLHERLRTALEKELGKKFSFDETLGLPGFHVFEYHEAFTRPVASVHVDLQHKDIDWSRYEDVDLDGQLSLTLSIRLPSSGAGLRLWPVTLGETRDMTPADLKRIVAREPELHPYRAGKLVLHSGYQLHQIAPSVGMAPGDERVTLQAHAHPVRGGYVLYW